MGGDQHTSADWRKRQEVARVLDRDPYFMDEELTRPAIGTLRGAVLTATQRANLLIALQADVYRRYLAGRVIGEVLGQLEGRR